MLPDQRGGRAIVGVLPLPSTPAFYTALGQVFESLTVEFVRRKEPFAVFAWPYVRRRFQVSGGLLNTGSSTGGCRDNRRGQTYTRGTWYRGRYAIMYSWYFPKDQLTDGGGNFGHRHDWENVVIWIDNRKNSYSSISFL